MIFILINVIMVACIASIVTLVLNFIFYKKEFKEVINIFKRLFTKNKKANLQCYIEFTLIE